MRIQRERSEAGTFLGEAVGPSPFPWNPTIPKCGLLADFPFTPPLMVLVACLQFLPMSHAYARNYVHLVFGTKDRHPWIKLPLQQPLWTYLAGIARDYGNDVLAVGGIEDHVHLLLCMPPKISVAAITRALKANSSKWMNESGHLFGWQQGYGSFSVSASHLHEVAEYIRNQAEHHRKRDFREEFLALLRKHGIPFTPEHVLR